LPYRRRPHRPVFAGAATALVLLLALVFTADRPTSSRVENVTAEATSSAGATVSYAAPMIEDDNGRSVGSACSPASGSVFALGTTTVKCTATDPTGGETRSVTFATNVVDTTPPELAGVPSEIDVQAGPRGETSVTYGTPTASDAVDGAVPATCSPASGSTFGAGTTSVTCTAADSRGNSAGASFSVVVGNADEPAVTTAATDKPPTTETTTTDTTTTDTTTTDTTTTDTTTTDTTTTETTTTDTTTTETTTTDTTTTDTTTTTATTATTATTVTTASTTTATTTTAAPTTVTVTTPSPGTTTAPFTPPAQPDRTPPANVSGLAASPRNHGAVLAWKPPADDDLADVEILRAQASGSAKSAMVYRGTGSTFTDTGLVNGLGYRYVVVSVDRAGNRSGGASVTLTPHARTLVAPAAGATVKRPPTLRWVQVPGADYYNVQLFRGRAKILSIWPGLNRLLLPKSWRYGGRRFVLTPGTYYWYVFPGYGAHRAQKYGPVLGQSSFVVR
jgi:hypothetical protein